MKVGLMAGMMVAWMGGWWAGRKVDLLVFKME
jgi:hypothetical protein